MAAVVFEETPSIASRHRVESTARRLYKRLAGTRTASAQSSALSLANASSEAPMILLRRSS